MVTSGEADDMITEIIEAGYYIGQDDRLAAPLINEPFTHGEIGVLLPKGSEDLRDYVNEFLRKEKESGRIDQFIVRPFLNDRAAVQHQNAVAMAYGWRTTICKNI